jgi:transglutaminase-like putative cysteine protease
MRRTALVYALPAAVVAFAWLRMEEPRAGGAGALWMVLLALVPALLPGLGLSLLVLGPATLFAAWLALGRPLGDGGFFPIAWERFEDGFVRFYEVRVPFVGGELPEMHGVVLLAIFAFCLALAFAVRARRPLPAVLVLIAGAGWPATLLTSQSIVYGAVILTAALWILAGLRLDRPTLALAAGALVVVAAAGVSTSAAVAKEGVVDWQRWDPYGAPDAPVSVSYVWDANYGGIEFPSDKTTVLRITGTDRKLYWRATTLNRFTDDRWIESLAVRVNELASGELPEDALLPDEARVEDALVTQEVQVVGLRDRHLIAASTPVGIDGESLGLVTKYSDGVVELNRSLERGERYTVTSYAPRAQPAELAELDAEYPTELAPYFELERTSLPAFGTPGRSARVARIFDDERQRQLWPYEALSRQAESVARGARTPYGAVVAIEAWLRSTGGFTYDEQPQRPAGAPALAHFVTQGKRGYCQHFAGSMALMLRFLGVPARVATGFTSGDYRDGVWNVTDHNAHAWVEVWFPGYGWLSFDPTPGRGELAGAYSASSQEFNAGDAASAFAPAPATGRGLDPTTGGLGALIQLQEGRAQSPPVSVEEGIGAFWIVVGLVAAVGGAIGLGKLLRRRLRYATSDPRRIAAAARRELADFLVDQGLAVDASATPDELHALVRSELGIDGRPFATALAAARFGPPAASGTAAESARRELKRLLHAIRGSLGRPQRLRGFVALRSLRARA